MRQWTWSWCGVGVCVLVATLGGCGGNDVDRSSPPYYPGSRTQGATAGEWQTWVVTDPATLLPGTPAAADSAQTGAELATLQALANARTADDQANIDFWSAGTTTRWTAFTQQLIASRGINAAEAARIQGAGAVAMYDAMVVAFGTKYAYLRARPADLDPSLLVYGTQPDSPSFVSERAAMSAACATVLRHVFDAPADVAAIDAFEQSARDADLRSGIHFPSDVDAGAAIGNSVGQLVITRLMQAGAAPNGTGGAAAALADRWTEMASELGTSHGLDETQQARVHALLGVARSDAARAAAGQGAGRWLPAVGTPALTGGPSLEAAIAAAAARVLGYLFPDQAGSIEAAAAPNLDGSSAAIAGQGIGQQIGTRVIEIASVDATN